MFVFSRYETGPFVSFISTAKYCSRFQSSNRADNRVQWYLQSNISILSNILHPDIRSGDEQDCQLQKMQSKSVSVTDL